MKPAFVSTEEGFLGDDAAAVIGPEDARAVIIPFGLEASVSYGSGTGAGPAAIIEASQQVELYDPQRGCEPVHRFGIATMAPTPIPPQIPAALELLDQLVEGVVAAGRFPLVLGGEHAVTPGAIRPLHRRHPNLALLHIDAHADLRDGYLGEHFSHASAIRRCLDLPGVDVVSIGIRNISAEGAAWLAKNPDRMKVHWGWERARYDYAEIVRPLAGRPVYVTIDLDGFDPSIMPATGTPEPGGILWEDAMGLIAELTRISPIVGADVVELAPIEGFPASDFLAAKLCYRLLAAALLDQPVVDPAQA